MSLSILNRLQENPNLFVNKKVVVMGDIALDRTFLCHPPIPGFHATHGQEVTFDVKRDDFGTVGSSSNTCLFWNSFGADSLLITVTGNDDEGKRVKEVLQTNQVANNILILNGIQTVTRFRFFVFNQNEGRYDLVYRIDKEPDLSRAYEQAEALVRTDAFLSQFRSEILASDALVLNDTEKGFLSPRVLESIGPIVRDVNQRRKETGLLPVAVIVDPKFDWDKFKVLPVDILKPNEKEAAKAVNLAANDLGDDQNLRTLGERLYQQYKDHFLNIVITLGRHGAALLQVEDPGARLFRFPP